MDIVDYHRITHQHTVKPATAPGTSGRGAKLVTFGAYFIFKLEANSVGNGPSPTRRVGLDAGDGFIDSRGSDTTSRTQAADYGIGGRDKWIRAKINIQERPLRAFEKNGFLVIQRVIQVKRGIADVRAKFFSVLQILLVDTPEWKSPGVKNFLENFVLFPEIIIQLGLKNTRVQEINHTDPATADLIRVARADAASRGPDLVFFVSIHAGRPISGDTASRRGRVRRFLNAGPHLDPAAREIIDLF